MYSQSQRTALQNYYSYKRCSVIIILVALIILGFGSFVNVSEFEKTQSNNKVHLLDGDKNVSIIKHK